MIELIPKGRWSELDWSDWGEQPQEGDVYGYTKDGKVVGYYLVERGMIHVGPFHVEVAHRGNGIASTLAQHAYDTLGSRYFVAATTDQTKAMCEKHGMSKIDGVLFEKQ